MLDRQRMARAIVVLAVVSGCEHEGPTADDEDPDEPEGPRTCLVDELFTEVPDYPLAYSTEHVDVFVSENRFVCAGTALEYERHVQYTADMLGIELQRTIPFYMVDLAKPFCSDEDVAACATRDGVVFAVPGTSHHELTHATACEIRTGAPKILTEGLAMAMEPYALESKSDPREYADETESFGLHYAKAGHFVRWFFDQVGPAAFREVYATANYDDGVWTALLEVYGPTLAEDYLADAPALWVPHRQCADVPVVEPDADGSWDLSTRLDCAEEHTLGPYERVAFWDDHRRMYRSVLIEITEPGLYRFARTGSVSVGYERCLDEHPATEEDANAEWRPGSVFFTFVGNDSEVEFERAGWYRLDLHHELGPAVDVGLTLDPIRG